MQIFIRFAKRLAVFLPGIIIAYASWRYFLPFFDRRLPDIVSILVTYALAAYLLIPGLIRIWRIIWPPEHLPLYCVTPDGFASDPLNVGIVCNRRELIKVMEKAGWFLADSHTPKAVVKQIISIVFGWEYPTGPVSNLYLFGRKQDLSFEIAIKGNNVRRHHVRFWATTFDKDQQLSASSIHWHHRRTHVQGDQLLWVGAASLDIGIVPIRHNWQLTHMVHPDTNQERELIVNGIAANNLVERVDKFKLDNPYSLVNRTWRGELRADGMMAVVWLKKEV